MEGLFPPGSAMRALLDALPTVVLVTDRNARVLDLNRAARDLVGDEPGGVLPPGDVLHCTFAHEPGGCGHNEACVSCLIRGSVEGLATGGERVPRLAHAVLRNGGPARDYWFRVAASPLAHEGRDLVLLAMEDVTQFVELREVLPLCPGCGSARDPQEIAQEARLYLKRHPGALAARELCPRCLRETAPAPYREDVL